MTSFPDGPFDRTLARAAGFNDAVIGAAVADGRLRRVCRGVYVASSRQDTQDLRAQSLALVIPYASAVGAELTRWAGHRGVAQARELLGWAEPLTESPMESRSRLQLLDAGLPRPVAQHPVRLLDGRWVRLDLAYPERLLAVEFDGI